MDHKDRIDTIEFDLEGALSDEEAQYSSAIEDKENTFTAKLKSKIGISVLLTGAATLAVVAFAVIVLKGSDSVSIEIQMRSLDRRLQTLEETLYRLEWIEAKLEHIEEQNNHFAVFMKTVESLGGRKKNQTNQVSTRKKDASYHHVRKGETLYSISRRHGLTVEELRRLNQLNSEGIIHPKQRLLIRPASDG